MSAEIVNLRQARKQALRQAREQAADANRVLHAIPAKMHGAARSATAKAKAHLDRHRREGGEPEA